MPDRYGDTEPNEPPDDIWAAEHRAMAIAHCGLCDDEGVRGAHVCDHREHSTPETRAAARELLARALHKPGGAA